MAQWSVSVDSSLLMHFSFSFSGHQALSLFFTNYFKNNLYQTCHTLSYSFSSNQFTPMALLPLRVTYTLLLHKIGILGFRIFSNCYKGYQIVSKINSESFIMVSNIFKFIFCHNPSPFQWVESLLKIEWICQQFRHQTITGRKLYGQFS